MLDKTALGIYLGISLGVSWLLALVLLLAGDSGAGVSTLREGALLLGLLLLPAAAALIASTLTRDSRHPRVALWPIAPRPVIVFAILAPVAFMLMHGVGVGLGFGSVDWSAAELQAELPAPEEVGLQQQLPALFLLIAGFLLTVVLGPTLFALVALGNEIGWRAYLAQKLEPLGRWRAGALCGVLWGLSWFPIVFLTAWSGETGFLQALSQSVRGLIAATLFGMLLCEVFRRTRHVGLTAVLAGCFYGQEFGMWAYLVPQHNPWVIGPLGLLGYLIMSALVLLAYLMPAWERLLGLPAASSLDEAEVAAAVDG